MKGIPALFASSIIARSELTITTPALFSLIKPMITSSAVSNSFEYTTSMPLWFSRCLDGE
ncbi:MAG: hypothetical protein A4E65_01586 [Syntrophorhabdus sp. PtaU1.Bin153]|nr:MAG: hypothetical protein A4E65_01586 [Syntrophorhabdus sp. PtaU1.Bin153]